MEHQKGTVIRRMKGFYYLRTQSGLEIECKIKGQLFKDSRFDNQIAVGDSVLFKKRENDRIGLITGIEKRKSFLSRARIGIGVEQVIAANVDILLIVMSAKDPPFRVNLINRFLVAALAGNIIPILVISKVDLVNAEYLSQLTTPYIGMDLRIIRFSTMETETHPELTKVISDNICVLAGQSGVGKSSLLNTLFPRLSIKIGKINRKTLKGSHTTTNARMHQVAENGFVIDTPGIREFGLWNVSKNNLDQYYPGFEEYIHGCKHRNCHHVTEPKCSVKSAVERGDIHRVIYNGYLSIYHSLSGK